ncbi:type II toxin-antitoxin system Phd/YefM family antitoxin [Microbacterium sp. Leaf159]|uniref:type II toxin-antitoxin system Phd/YefM family antitoxin n=1 Tax=Microbacterium sp. Leaf159 TaxID=1736279 RepID=UPI0006FFAB6C|nr:type II toxin-antitoxin system Phd/YefM family antitoxin [Microbacterium sp. Leaf159]KQR37591.1 hypothetical protein ASF80_17810 [Microbacterium sp. Leaf159]
MFTITARELKRSVARALRIADDQLVMITKRGEPAYVLLSIGGYERLRSPTPAKASRSFIDVIPPLPDGVDPDLFGQIMDEIAIDRSRDFGREADLGLAVLNPFSG